MASLPRDRDVDRVAGGVAHAAAAPKPAAIAAASKPAAIAAASKPAAIAAAELATAVATSVAPSLRDVNKVRFRLGRYFFLTRRKLRDAGKETRGDTWGPKSRDNCKLTTTPLYITFQTTHRIK